MQFLRLMMPCGQPARTPTLPGPAVTHTHIDIDIDIDIDICLRRFVCSCFWLLLIYSGSLLLLFSLELFSDSYF